MLALIDFLNCIKMFLWNGINKATNKKMVEAEGNCPPRPKIRPDEDNTSLVYESRFMPFL